jgi:hypothetical protein
MTTASPYIDEDKIICYNVYRDKETKEAKCSMSLTLVNALLAILKYCMNHENCKTCELQAMCGR